MHGRGKVDGLLLKAYNKLKCLRRNSKILPESLLSMSNAYINKTLAKIKLKNYLFPNH